MEYFTVLTDKLACSRNSRVFGHITVVCLHGNSTDIRIWEPLQKMADGIFNVVAISVPGHGGHVLHEPISFNRAVELIYNAIKEIGVRRIYFLGASLGGHLAIEVARKSNTNHYFHVEGIYLAGVPLASPEINIPQFVPDISKNKLIVDVLGRGLLFQEELFNDSDAHAFAACQGPPNDWLGIMTDAAKKTSQYARLISQDLFTNPRNELQTLIDILPNKLLSFGDMEPWMFVKYIHGEQDAAISLDHLKEEVQLIAKKKPQLEISLSNNLLILSGTHSTPLTNTRDLYAILHELDDVVQKEKTSVTRAHRGSAYTS